MATTPLANQTSEVSGSVPFYSNPAPLNADAMKTLGMVKAEKPFAFVRVANAVPLAVTEFHLAALRMPVIFSGSDFFPLAVMGVRQDENLFVRDDGYFDVDIYIPAFIRRYPFVLAKDGEMDRMIVCIDRDADSVAENGETPLFVNGEPSEFTKQAISFCSDYEVEIERTRHFVADLKRFDLLELMKSMFTPPTAPDAPAAEPVMLAEYYGVSEEKLNALSAEDLVELQKSGALKQIYAHIASLQNWEKLANVTLMRDNERAALKR